MSGPEARSVDRDRIGVAVIGGGVVGAAVAAALADAGHEVWLLEATGALGAGVSSRNSGVIHSGLYYPPGSLKAETCIRGNRLLYAWLARAGVWFRKTGKLVVACAPEQLAPLAALEQNARASGAPGLSVLDRAAVGRLEPGVPAAGALYCSESGIVDVHELVLSLKAAAEAKGAVFVTHAEVRSIEIASSGFKLETTRGPVLAERVVNAAGLRSDIIARLVGLDRYTLYPCRGDYFRLRSPAQYRHLIYPVKDPRQPGLGIHLTLDRAGGYRLGPDATYVEDRADFAPLVEKALAEKHALFVAAARRLLGPVAPEQIVYDDCGIRPKLRAPGETMERDFVLEEHPTGCLHLIGIESPGLTASLALAEQVAQLFGPA